jgi:hypothetical protein
VSPEMAKIIEAFEAESASIPCPRPRFTLGYTRTTIRAWFFSEDRPRFRRPSLTFDGSPLLTFTDFVEALYVSELRRRFHISFPPHSASD